MNDEWQDGSEMVITVFLRSMAVILYLVRMELARRRPRAPAERVYTIAVAVGWLSGLAGRKPASAGEHALVLHAAQPVEGRLDCPSLTITSHH